MRTLTTISAIAMATWCLAGVTSAVASPANPGGAGYAGASAPAVSASGSGGASAGQPGAGRKAAKKRGSRPHAKAHAKPKTPRDPVQQTPSNASVATSGGQQYTAPIPPAGPVPAGMPTVPGSVAKVLSNGQAAAPLNAPRAVQEVIWAANKIVGLPYLWGGGHASWSSPGGYDCSGTVSFALHGANLLSSPLVSGDFESWGAPGRGQWITIEANGGHVYMYVAGIRLDTSAVNDNGPDGPNWRRLARSNSGFTTVHPVGL